MWRQVSLLRRRESGNAPRKLLVDGDLLLRDASNLEADLLGHALRLVSEDARIAIATILRTRLLSQLVRLKDEKKNSFPIRRRIKTLP